MTAKDFDFTDTKVVLTGACGVFGRRIAAAFARAGAWLCLSDNRPGPLDALATELGLDDGRAFTHETELRAAASIDDLVSSVGGRWGAPDIVINNAAIYPSGGLLDLAADEWDRIMDVNLRAPFLVARGCARLMKDRQVAGKIVNISSGAARKINVGTVPYCVSKTALDRLTKGLALEFAPFGVRVNVVEPGFAAGSEVSPLTEAQVQKVLRNIPLGRPSGQDDAANAIMFLCSDRAEFITGATLSVDGGNSIGN